MPDRYPHFWGGSQICSQSAPPVKGTNGEKLKMLKCKFACISDPAANTMETVVTHKGSLEYKVWFCTGPNIRPSLYSSIMLRLTHVVLKRLVLFTPAPVGVRVPHLSVVTYAIS